MPGGPGRKPIPINLHLLKSGENWRVKKKKKQVYPKPAGDVPASPPEWLNYEARQEWAKVTEAMRGTGTWTSADMGTLESYCYWYGQFRELAFCVDAIYGLVALSCTGAPKENPLVRMAREASRKALEFAVQLGLSPSARMKLGTKKPEGEETDPFAKHETQGKKGPRSA